MTKSLAKAKAQGLAQSNTAPEATAPNVDKWKPGQLFVYKDHGWYAKVKNRKADGRYKLLYSLDGKEWGKPPYSGYEEADLEGKDSGNYTPIDSVDDIERGVVEYLTNPHGIQEPEADNKTTALAETSDKTRLIALRDTLEIQRNRIKAISDIVRARLDGLTSHVSALRKQIQQVMRVIGAIEMYLGIHQEVYQIRDGEPASPDTPVALRQQILFMDEEAGDIRPRGAIWGIDWRSVEDFDAWVAQPQNTARLLPEMRGAVLIRPSRQKRTYSDNAWINDLIEDGNRWAYLLVRNGERLYRIWINAKLSVNRLFPTANEFEALRKSSWHSDQDRAKELEFGYKENLLLIQGLLDRADVFAPMNAQIKLSDPDTYGNMLLLIRDDEASLTDGRLPFREWQLQINKAIARGSRIILAFEREWFDKRDFKDRFLIYVREVPGLPDEGLYTVHEADGSPDWHERKDYPTGRKTVLTIRFLPSNEWRYEERKNRLSFIIKPSDRFVLNYDQISLADLEFYLNSRLDRGNYLQVIPLLWYLREQRLQEIEHERGLVALLAGRLGCADSVVWGAVEWWKNKVIWKRPIREDDAKALRMIEAKIKRDLGR